MSFQYEHPDEGAEVRRIEICPICGAPCWDAARGRWNDETCEHAEDDWIEFWRQRAEHAEGVIREINDRLRDVWPI